MTRGHVGTGGLVNFRLAIRLHSSLTRCMVLTPIRFGEEAQAVLNRGVDLALMATGGRHSATQGNQHILAVVEHYHGERPRQFALKVCGRVLPHRVRATVLVEHSK